MTLLLSRSQISSLMAFPDYIQAVEQAFLLLGSGKITAGILDLPGIDGMFHVKGATMPIGEKVYVAVKINGNFPQNRERFHLPTIQGAILLCDGIRGVPLALLDSMEITIQRTGAATALAAGYLARKDSATATICGCGNQGRVQLRALLHALPLQQAFAFDVNPEYSERFANEMSAETGIQVQPVHKLPAAVEQSDVVVTCTTSQHPILWKADVQPGTFIAAVGADSHNKQEIDPALMASAKVVADVLDQCARIGDLHHAIQAALMTREDVYAELAQLVCHTMHGRVNDQEITVFDSTGTAIQDVASAAVVYERAVLQNPGSVFNLAE